MKLMKSLQLLSSWTVESVADRAGRRMLSISTSSPRQPAWRRVARRRNSGLPLAVTFAPEEWSEFEPVIRARSRSSAES